MPVLVEKEISLVRSLDLIPFYQISFFLAFLKFEIVEFMVRSTIFISLSCEYIGLEGFKQSLFRLPSL